MTTLSLLLFCIPAVYPLESVFGLKWSEFDKSLTIFFHHLFWKHMAATNRWNYLSFCTRLVWRLSWLLACRNRFKGNVVLCHSSLTKNNVLLVCGVVVGNLDSDWNFLYFLFRWWHILICMWYCSCTYSFRAWEDFVDVLYFILIYVRRATMNTFSDDLHWNSNHRCSPLLLANL